jgi:hypothetical protein
MAGKPAEEQTAATAAQLEREAFSSAVQKMLDLVDTFEGWHRELKGGWDFWRDRFQQVKTAVTFRLE